jgi:hypothetical protein
MLYILPNHPHVQRFSILSFFLHRVMCVKLLCCAGDRLCIRAVAAAHVRQCSFSDCCSFDGGRVGVGAMSRPSVSTSTSLSDRSIAQAGSGVVCVIVVIVVHSFPSFFIAHAHNLPKRRARLLLPPLIRRLCAIPITVFLHALHYSLQDLLGGR